ERGSAGAKRPPSVLQCRQPFGARGGGLSAGRGRETHTRVSLRSHPATQSRALIVPGPRAAALANSDMSWGAARDGLPCIPLLEAHSLAHLPRPYEGATS